MQVFITGVSKGLGKSLAELYLEKGEEVIGIGRSHDIHHPNFRFISCDLANLEAVQNCDFGPLKDEVLFINNAGEIGEIARISEQEKNTISTIIHVNTVAPFIFCHKITKAFQPKHGLTILNISSGAGKRPIPGWATYCASKAALDLFSETLFLEEKELGKSTKVFSVAPGVVDTDMQSTIRNAAEKDFSSSANFHALKNSGQLLPPQKVAKLLQEWLEKQPDGEVVCSVKDL
jgi:benzil reductase ((S)-benzoin forming)